MIPHLLSRNLRKNTGSLSPLQPTLPLQSTLPSSPPFPPAHPSSSAHPSPLTTEALKIILGGRHRPQTVSVIPCFFLPSMALTLAELTFTWIEISLRYLLVYTRIPQPSHCSLASVFLYQRRRVDSKILKPLQLSIGFWGDTNT